MSAPKKTAAKKVATKAAPTAPAESVVVRKSQLPAPASIAPPAVPKKIEIVMESNVSSAQYIADAIASLKGEADVLVFGIDESSQKHQDSNAGRVFFIETSAHQVRSNPTLNAQQIQYTENTDKHPKPIIAFRNLVNSLSFSTSLVVLNSKQSKPKAFFYAYVAAKEKECKLIISGQLTADQHNDACVAADWNNYELTQTLTDLTVWMPKQN